MLKSVRNIRKLHNVKILFLSSDNEVKVEFEEKFNEYFKELKIVDNSVEALTLLKEQKFDMLLIDTQIKDCSFEDFCETISSLKLTIPNIVLSNDNSDLNIMNAINCNAYTFLLKPIKQEYLRLAIIMCLNQTKRSDKIEFKHGIYFDEYRDQFYKKGDILIEFTKLEKGFLKLLIEKSDEVIDYETIKERVWKGKEMSVFTMRNVVNKIRQKTYFDLIKNRSNKGYIIDISRK